MPDMTSAETEHRPTTESPRGRTVFYVFLGTVVVCCGLVAVLSILPRNAETVLQQALAAAHAQGKRVMIVIPDGQHRKFVLDNLDILGKYYVVAEIHPEMRNYLQVASRFRKFGKGYIQYFGFTAILETDGTVLGTSGEIPDGPIGIPLTTSPEDRARYLTLLKETAMGISPAELSAIDQAADRVTAGWKTTPAH